MRGARHLFSHAIVVPNYGFKRPVSRPADESGLKPSLATTTAKASRRVIADPPGSERHDELVHAGTVLACIDRRIA